jgi:F1F0 ATPase subunit 2
MMLDIGMGLFAGMVAGAAFFGGLRWTVSKIPTVRYPALLAAASLLVRGAGLALVLVLVADGRFARVLGGLAGVLAARSVLVSLTRSRIRTPGESTWT